MSENWEEQLKTIWEITKEGKVYGLSDINEIKKVFEKWDTIKQTNEIKDLRSYIGMECANIGLGSIGRNNGTRNVDEQIWNDITKRLNKITENNNQDIDKIIQDNNGLEHFKSVKQFLFKTITLELCTKCPKEDVLFIADEQTINRLLSLLGIEKKGLGFFQKCKKIMDATANCMPEGNINKFEYNVRRSAALWYLGSGAKVDDFPTDVQPNVIFYGAPGTGKTYFVKNMIDLVCQGDTSRYEWVQFHPSYTYEDFIEGIKPTGITKNGSVKLELVNGIFKNLCIRAKKDENPEHKYYFIADEINRANLSAVFGETLSLIEADYRDDTKSEEHPNLIDTQYSQIERAIVNADPKKTAIYYDEKNPGKFGIPKNVYFIGMMNDVDKSIDAFDLALRRRFKWVRKDCDTEVVRAFLNEKEIKEESIEKYIKSIDSLNKFISDELKLGKSFEFGHSFFMKITFNKDKKIEKKHKEVLFKNYLKPTLTEYLRSLYDNEEELKKNLDSAKNRFVEEK